MDLKEKIVDFLSDCSDNDLMGIYNEYCNESGNSGDVYWHDGFFSDMCIDADEAARAVWASGSDYNYQHEFLKITAYGNYETSNDLRYLLDVDFEEIADYIIENDNSLCSDVIADLLQEYKEKHS